MSPLFDIGLNLAHDSFDHDREAVFARALDAGVTRMLVTGSSFASIPAAISLVHRWPAHLRATAGIHPHHSPELTPDRSAELLELMRQPEVLAAGECGLDYFRDFAPRDVQRQAFEIQLELAAAAGKPLFLHQRDAHEDFLAILDGQLARLSGGVAHCFTDTLEAARAYLDRGLYIGITGWICDERRGGALRDIVRYIPRDRLLIETDAPYLLPRNLEPRPKDRRNEPMYLPTVLATLAECRREDPELLARATTDNALELFAWPVTADVEPACAS
ncbi:MAG TPA: TatD family hydrolase [Steroidobacteraceae bacterium]|nr:TatD family hydrolase [Steroidobacteraceae bacterium]